MECQPQCGACCIAQSISSPIPLMPLGKPAGVRCVHLTQDYRCAIFGKAERPQVCDDFKPEQEMCGQGRERALQYLATLEVLTRPD
ncbi:MAG: hypothetical protein RLZZ422_445 [Pseudomonadota bacterium]